MDAILCASYRIPSNLDIGRVVIEIDASRLAECIRWQAGQTTSYSIDNISSNGCTSAYVIGNDTPAVI